MSLIDSLLERFRRPPAPTPAPEGVCPNCWGHSEYDGEVRAAIRDQQIDINNNRAARAFISEFVVTHIDGIRLRDTGCPRCGGG